MRLPAGDTGHRRRLRPPEGETAPPAELAEGVARLSACLDLAQSPAHPQRKNVLES